MSVYVIDTIKPKNGLDFPVVEAIDVAVEGYSSLADAVTHFATQAAINAATASLQAQIDQIEISASAEAVVAPEVAAARVGTGGTSYQTLKERLDAENTELNSKINTKFTNTINLINPDTLTDTYINSRTGTTVESDTYKTTDFIPISNGQSITISPGLRVFLAYNSSKVAIEESYVSTAQNTYTYTASQNGYIRFSFNKAAAGVSEQAEYGSTAHNFIEYGFYLAENIFFSNSQTIEIENLVENKGAEISSSLTSEFDAEFDTRMPPTKNLVNPAALTNGWISNNVGAITANENYETTDFIPVSSGQKVTISHLRFYLAYNSNKVAISETYATINDSDPHTYTATQDGFIRVTLWANEIGNSAQIEYGTQATSYVDYGFDLAENVYFSSNQKNQISQVIDKQVFDSYFIEGNLINPNTTVSGYIKSRFGEIAESDVYKTTDYIPIASGQSITISPGLRIFLAFDSTKEPIEETYNPTAQNNYTFTAVQDGFIRFSFATSNLNQSERAVYGTVPCEYLPYGVNRLNSTTRIGIADIEEIDSKIAANVLLAGKKWYPCGDSFTEGQFSGLESGYIFDNGELYEGKMKVYPYFIGNRTKMIVDNMGVSGMSLAAKEGSSIANCFTYPEGKYTQIPADADYITLYFGINDSHGNIPIGTADDDTNETFCGAWNIVFDWIYTNRPNAKVGVIISNGCDTTEYPTATIAMCKKWGIPYLDINGDETLPIVIRTNMRTSLDPAVKQRILEKYRVTEINMHPNVKAHEDESFMIQQFLERL